MLTPLDFINGRILDRLEDESFQEPREVETRCCDNCDGMPLDDYLYQHDGEWICGDCLLERHESVDADGGMYCEECGDSVRDTLYLHDGDMLCACCLADRYERKDIYHG